MQDGLRNVHSSMIQRCENPKRQQYSRYGGRGIKVCEEWHNYENFRKWALENGYKHPLKLDRIDNNGNYEPSNCRWVTNTENCRNKSNNITLVYEGEEKCVKEWCEIAERADEDSVTLWNFTLEDVVGGAIEANEAIQYWLINGRLYETMNELSSDK